MHIRRKKWARPELHASPFFEEDGTGRKGHWRELFPHPDHPLHLEMGCGKGVSTAQMAAAHPEINYVAVDISMDVLGDARRNIVRAYGEKPENIHLMSGDISLVETFFDRQDGPERIYISFCNPWSRRPKHEKRRLTHPRQLIQYRNMLQEEGEIWFKTDDLPLFEDSLAYFDLCGFVPVYLTRDLAHSGFAPNYVSEHEQKYRELGVPILFGIFRRNQQESDFDPIRFRLTPGVRERVLTRLKWEPGDSGNREEAEESEKNDAGENCP